MNSREISLKILYDVEENGAYINKSLNIALNNDNLSSLDKAFVTELTYGVLKNKIALDYIISQFSSIKLKKISHWILNIMRLGVYQMYYMDKIPHSAACNESVKLAKHYSHASGIRFVNGVLRNISRNIDKITFPDKKNLSEFLSVYYSFPIWMVDKFMSQYGAELCEKILIECNKSHLTSIRVNTLKTNKKELLDILSNENISASADIDMQNCILVNGAISINNLKSYKDGLFSFHNQSSMLTVEKLDPKPNELIMDMCAAPGGKSTYIAELMQNCGTVLSYDIHPHKIALINESAKRLGISIIKAEVNDSSLAIDKMKETADKVLVDAPCSGLGVIHKKADIKWTRKEMDIQALADIQQKILEASSSYVKTGGTLVYSTCTILKEENQDQIDFFLSQHSDFEKIYEKQILPDEKGRSGFYICKMVRVS